jgi:hypothetical protein
MAVAIGLRHGVAGDDVRALHDRAGITQPATIFSNQ